MITVYDFSTEKDRREYYKKVRFFSEAVEPSVCSFDEETGELIEEKHLDQDNLPKRMVKLLASIKEVLNGDDSYTPVVYDGRYGIMFHSMLRPAKKGQLIGTGTFNLAISLKQKFPYPVCVLYNYYDDNSEDAEVMSDVEIFIDFESAKATDFEEVNNFFKSFEYSVTERSEV